MCRSSGTTSRRSGAWATGFDTLKPGNAMPIRLRLAVAFAVIAAAVFALGSWLFASGLSSAQLNTIDSQLTVQLTQAGRYLPSGSAAGSGAASSPSAVSPPPGDYVIQVIDPAGHVRGASPAAGTVPLVTADQLSQARHGQISVTQTVDEESARIAAVIRGAASRQGPCPPCGRSLAGSREAKVLTRADRRPLSAVAACPALRRGASSMAVHRAAARAAPGESGKM